MALGAVADFGAQMLMRSTHFKYSTNVHTKHVTRHYAKPLLPAVISVHQILFSMQLLFF
jgi:hypothetical protein